ncbi:hypothetical protein BDF19DRAFT_282553 [Syncephalis fuscata]|nr:hypothetical protein BDF19DRAFT_282553 [Syncephalis fuscata]
MVQDVTTRNAEMQASLEEYRQLLNDSREEAARLREQVLCPTTIHQRSSSYADSVFLDEEVASAVGSRRGSISSVATNPTPTAHVPSIDDIDSLCLSPPIRSMSCQGTNSTRQQQQQQQPSLRHCYSIDFPPAPVQATPTRSPELRPVSDIQDGSLNRTGAVTDDDQVYVGRLHHRQQQMRSRRGARRWTEITPLPSVTVTDATTDTTVSPLLCIRCQHSSDTTAITTNEMATQTDPVLTGSITRRVTNRPQSISVMTDSQRRRRRRSSCSNSPDGGDSDEEASSYDEYDYYGDEEEGEALMRQREAIQQSGSTEYNNSNPNTNYSNNNNNSNNDNDDENDTARFKREKKKKKTKKSSPLRLNLSPNTNDMPIKSLAPAQQTILLTPNEIVASPISEHITRLPLVGNSPLPSQDKIVEFTTNEPTTAEPRQPLVRLLSRGKSPAVSMVVDWGSADEHTWTPRGSIYSPNYSPMPTIENEERKLTNPVKIERKGSMAGRIEASARALWRRSTASLADITRNNEQSPQLDQVPNSTQVAQIAAANIVAATQDMTPEDMLRRHSLSRRHSTIYSLASKSSSPRHSIALSEECAQAVLSPPFVNHAIRTSISSNRPASPLQHPDNSKVLQWRYPRLRRLLCLVCQLRKCLWPLLIHYHHYRHYLIVIRR